MTTNAWQNQLGTLRIRSLALPADGGVLNPRTAGKYSLHTTNVAKTIKREHARLKAQAQAQTAATNTIITTTTPASAAPAVVLALAPALRAKAS